MENNINGLKDSIDFLIYIGAGLGLFEAAKTLISFLFRDYFNRSKSDIKELSDRIESLERKHNDCPVDELSIRLSTMEKCFEYLRDKLDKFHQ